MVNISSELFLVLLWVAFVAFLGKKVLYPKPETVLGKEEMRYSKGFAFLAVIPLMFWAANRSWNYGDTGSYIMKFWSMPDSLSGISGYLDTIGKDKGFYFFSCLIKCFITQDRIIYFFIIAFVQLLSITKLFRKYSSDYVFSLCLFVVSTDYVIWMFNGMRQFLAVTITLFALPFILRKKYIPALLIILFASVFHQSSLIMLPLIFLLQGKAWSTRTMLIILGIIVAIMFVGRFTSLLDSALSETQYRNVVKDYTTSGDDGTNPLRVAVYSIPTIIAFIGRKKLQKRDDVLINFCTNASIVSTGLYALSMFTSGIFLGRLPIYLSLYNYILLPWEIKNIIPEKSRTVITVGMIVLYLVFYYYQFHFIWRVL